MSGWAGSCRPWIVVLTALAAASGLTASAPGVESAADPLPLVFGVPAQPLKAHASRVVQALDLVGAPLDAESRQAFAAALAEEDEAQSTKAVQQVLDRLCLAGVNINAESRVKAAPGPAPRQLMQHGWRVFLVKVHNEAGITPPLNLTSPNALPLHKRSTAAKEPELSVPPQAVEQRWLDAALYRTPPMSGRLSGLPLEYVLVELYSRDAGPREARLAFDVGQGTQDLDGRNEIHLLFQCERAVAVRLDVLDHDGQPTTGQFVFRDTRDRIYPARARRLAPDFFFHDQVYRAHGETVLLPPGTFNVTYTRGPEYQIETRQITVPPAAEHQEKFQLRRWIHLADAGWFSGDHHVHAAGCSHYESPSEGVQPEDMLRHILGEDLNVGCVLSWGPCWYFQKQFFSGGVHPASQDRYVMRYDVEVSGFPSSHCGHLCLLRLKEDDYPGTTRVEDWPSWDLPILQWGKDQGGVVGFSHSGWGLKVAGDKLPTDEVPAFDGIGANEYVMDVTHGAVDFISTVDTPAPWELNVWYHTLNCGYTARISGETDFPCIYGERVGLGRSYVKLPANRPVDFDAWCEGIKHGRSYVSEGLSHLFDFQVNGLGVGEPGDRERPSVLSIAKGSPIRVRVKAAALLDPMPRTDLRGLPLDQKPYWHIERARIGDSRTVPVELIVNGRSVGRQTLTADGRVQELAFEHVPERSSWVALRIYPSSHTNPVFIEVDGQPIRASRRSAEWCLRAVDVCWAAKQGQIRELDRVDAAEAYDHARREYRQRLAESYDDTGIAP